MSSIQEQLVSHIRSVFNVRLSGRDIFVETAEQYFDVEAAIDDLFFSDWRGIPPAALIKHRHQLGFLELEAFRFYVPAIICAVVLHPHEVDTLHTSVVIRLTPPDVDSSVYDTFIRRVEQFTPEEAGVIAEFFEVYFDLFPLDQWGISNKGIKEILDNQKYWLSRALNS